MIVGIKSRLQSSALKKMGKDGMETLSNLKEEMVVLEKHMLVITENQVEFEKYLKDIQSRLKNIEEK